MAIHGIGSSWRAWKPVLPALERCHDVLALSLPGYGESEPLEGEPTVPALADAVEAAMDAEGVGPAHLVGNSLGGWIAAELAARGRARSAVAISPAGLWTRRELRWSALSLRASYRGARLLAPSAERLTASTPARTLLFSGVNARPWRLDPREAAYAIRMLANSPSFTSTLNWIAGGGRTATGLERIDCPFRVLWGSRDTLLLPRQGPRWARRVAGAELRVLPGLGHVPMSDDPELVAREILAVTGAGAAG